MGKALLSLTIHTSLSKIKSDIFASITTSKFSAFINVPFNAICESIMTFKKAFYLSQSKIILGNFWRNSESRSYFVYQPRRIVHA